jgi:hypothetical protein
MIGGLRELPYSSTCVSLLEQLLLRSYMSQKLQLGALLRIRDVYPGPRIQQQQQKKGEGKNQLSYLFFCSQKYPKIVNNFIFDQVKKKGRAPYTPFYPKNCHYCKLAKIWVLGAGAPDPGSGKAKSPSMSL